MSGAGSWDERYRRGEHASAAPNPLLALAVERHARDFFGDRRRPPRALDVACGAGRHALLLAARGFRVTAVDASRVGVEIALRRARERGLALDARVADLERGEFRIEADAYHVVCDFQYLQRDLFAPMRDGVRRGGLFVAAIHLAGAPPGARPMNPDFLLRPGELREQFRGWEILHYHEPEAREGHKPEGREGHKPEGREAADACGHTRPSAEIIARRPS